MCPLPVGETLPKLPGERKRGVLPSPSHPEPAGTGARGTLGRGTKPGDPREGSPGPWEGGKGARGEAAFAFNKEESERAGPGNQTGETLLNLPGRFVRNQILGVGGGGHGGVRKGKK